VCVCTRLDEDEDGDGDGDEFERRGRTNRDLRERDDSQRDQITWTGRLERFGSAAYQYLDPLPMFTSL
jgi:hypothetical protein